MTTTRHGPLRAVLAALDDGRAGSLDELSREAGVDRELTRLALDHLARLGLVKAESVSTSCPSSGSGGCGGCPLVRRTGGCDRGTIGATTRTTSVTAGATTSAPGPQLVAFSRTRQAVGARPSSRSAPQTWASV